MPSSATDLVGQTPLTASQKLESGELVLALSARRVFLYGKELTFTPKAAVSRSRVLPSTNNFRYD